MAIVNSFLGATFLNTGNYLKRVNKLKALEAEECGK
jgi:hypothetical protein